MTPQAMQALCLEVSARLIGFSMDPTDGRAAAG
jgi:hypothetical protein